MTSSEKAFVSLLGLLLIVGLGAWFIVPKIVVANPSIFAPTKATGAATTTVVYMRPGLATTTLAYDSLDGDTVKVDELTLAIQYTASTTGPTLKMRFEDSHDGINWYPRGVSLNENATTTRLVGSYNEYIWTVATTTDIGGSGTAARVHTSFTVKAPMRHVRAVFYVPAGGGNGALWAQFVPIKEDHE